MCALWNQANDSEFALNLHRQKRKIIRMSRFLDHRYFSVPFFVIIMNDFLIDELIMAVVVFSESIVDDESHLPSV